MLANALEDRFRASLAARGASAPEDSIRFAVDFAQVLVRVLPDEVDAASSAAARAALRARTELDADAIDALVRLAVAPEHRSEIGRTDLAAFGARFGAAAERSLRATVEDEVDLESFAAQHGDAETLLLLDSLFAVCAIDGEIDPTEIDRLQHAARRLGIDPMLVGLLFRKHDLRHAQGDAVYDLTDRDEVVIGRVAPADIRLPDPQVAPRHARLERTPDGWLLTDLRSGRPTLLRGSPVSSAPLAPGDELRVGPYRLALHASGESLTAFGSDALSSLSVRHLTRTVATREGPLTVLDDVSFTVFTGEVVALVGPSGAGKTSLLQAIAGIAPAQQGQVLLDGADFHTMLASDRSLVGIVPQDDLVHAELTVEESLRYAGRLRFPADVPSSEVQAAVDRVLAALDLEPIRGRTIGSVLARGISGGQRKRVSLGQELLTRTTRILFLDEPTSGLDPRTAQDIVTRVRQLADDGRIVFLVTHDVSPSLMALVDHLMVMAPGGQLAWFGPPDEARDHFGVATVDELFSRLSDERPEAWREAWAHALAQRKYVQSREHLLGLDAAPPPPTTRRPPRPSRRRQLATLTARYARVKLRDVTGTGVLLTQAPALALAFALVFPQADPALMFVAVLSALWFGASAAVRELIADRAIWRREARVGVGLGPYLASRIAVLGVLTTVQCLELVTILYFALGMAALGTSFPLFAGVAVATGLVGMSIGLAISSLFPSSEAAVGSLPIVLIPQIAFGGLIVKLPDMPWAAKAVTAIMPARYAFEAAIKTGDQLGAPSNRYADLAVESVRAPLYLLGFRGTDADDMGLTMPALFGVLGLFALGFLAIAAVGTGRTREER